MDHPALSTCLMRMESCRKMDGNFTKARGIMQEVLEDCIPVKEKLMERHTGLISIVENGSDS